MGLHILLRELTQEMLSTAWIRSPRSLGECHVIARRSLRPCMEVLSRNITVSDTRTAESVKMVENIFRNVNIALANELSLILRGWE